MVKKYFITGATGNVGSAVLDEFVGRGIPVYIGSKRTTQTLEFENGVFEVPFDYEDAASVDMALKGVDTLFLMTPVTDKQVFWATRAIDLAIKNGVKHIVRLSVAAAAMVPGIQLGRWHRTVERYLQGSGIDWTIIRPVPYMQNFLGLFSRSPRGDYTVPLSNGQISFVDAQDVGKFAAWSMIDETASNQVYLVSGDEVMSVDDAVGQINDMLGLRISYCGFDMETWQSITRTSGERPEWLIQILSELFGVLGGGAVTMTNDTFQQALGAQPSSFGEFITREKSGFHRKFKQT
jgi:uncharacterized protein YbjT (DUF2867 family)